MPSRPLRPCNQPGCPELVTKGYCEKHQKKINRERDSYRGNAAARGYDSRWRKYRRWFLARNPLCVECAKHNRKTPATDVDHIQAVSGPNDPMFYTPGNHQALCHSCHSKKTVKVDGGLGKG